MRIDADIARCEGHGLCEQVAPTVYALGDDAIVTVLDAELPPDLERPAVAGARVCPVAALTVVR